MIWHTFSWCACQQIPTFWKSIKFFAKFHRIAWFRVFEVKQLRLNILFVFGRHGESQVCFVMCVSCALMCALLGCLGALCWVWRMFAEGLDFSIDTIIFCNSELVCRGWFDCGCVCSWQCGVCANVHLCSLYVRKLMQVKVVYILHVLLQLFGRVGLDLVFLKANTACQRRSTGISSPKVVLIMLTNLKVWMQNH